MKSGAAIVWALALAGTSWLIAQAPPAATTPRTTRAASPMPATVRPGAVAVGEGAQALSGDGVAVGRNAVTRSHPSTAPGSGGETVALGADALAEGWRCTAVGARARAGVVSATALGRASYAWGPHMIAIGRGAYMEQVSGSAGVGESNACGIAGDSLWLGGTMCHKYVDRTGDTYVFEKADGGTGEPQDRWDVRTGTPGDYTIHGQDAYDARFEQDPQRFKRELYNPRDPATFIHREDKNVAGGSLVLAAGRGTGRGNGGSLEFQTAPAAAESANRKNPLKTAVKIDTAYAAENATPMLLWDNQAKKLKRVMVGPPDSGGPGFRALVIAN